MKRLRPGEGRGLPFIHEFIRSSITYWAPLYLGALLLLLDSVVTVTVLVPLLWTFLVLQGSQIVNFQMQIWSCHTFAEIISGVFPQISWLTMFSHDLILCLLILSSSNFCPLSYQSLNSHPRGFYVCGFFESVYLFNFRVFIIKVLKAYNSKGWYF